MIQDTELEGAESHEVGGEALVVPVIAGAFEEAMAVEGEVVVVVLWGVVMVSKSCHCWCWDKGWR